ncbi:MAG: YdcF family protein [Xanthomonadales bacterium]|nr:YdcF family protein [Xanthomonadales bacterium]
MDATPTKLLRRGLKALWLTASSGGVALWRQLRETRRIARDASVWSQAEVLLVPGHRLRGGEVGRRFAHRLNRTWQLCRKQPRELVLLSGYAGETNAPSEAQAALGHLADLGIGYTQAIALDNRAATTRQNLEGARKYLAAPTADGHPRRLAVISNRYHLARIGALARQLGMDVELVAAERRWRASPRACLALLLESAAIMTIDVGQPPPSTPLQPVTPCP